jgi:formylglycine-generating enzyme required for sulfatase activity
MNQKNLFLTILLLASVIVSGCGPSTKQPAFINTTTPAAVPTIVPTAMPTDVPTVMPTDVPAAEPTAMPTDIPTAEPTETTASTLAPGEIQVSDVDGMEMVYVPGGDFSMGSLVGTANEQPVHNVSLDDYWIDRTEVTNAMYHMCVQAGACLRPMVFSSNTHYGYYFFEPYANFPVIALKWSSAEAYCTWAGRRLPTEAEWEKAAVGTDGRTYPWGNDLPNSGLLNFNRPTGDAAAVGSFPFGASPYRVLDMAGNLTEWVADWYAADYYASSPSSNPTGPVEGQYKVLRGGSWHSDEYLVRSADRHWLAPDTRDVVVGFRCALTAP